MRRENINNNYINILNYGFIIDHSRSGGAHRG